MARNPTIIKNIEKCGGCPLSDRKDMPGCWGEFALDTGKGFRKFYAFDEKGFSIYPAPPPEWCPLREQDIILRLVNDGT